MNMPELKKAVSELLHDTGHLVNVKTDNRVALLLVRTQVLMSLLIGQVERIEKKT